VLWAANVSVETVDANGAEAADFCVEGGESSREDDVECDSEMEDFGLDEAGMEEAAGLAGTFLPPNALCCKELRQVLFVGSRNMHEAILRSL